MIKTVAEVALPVDEVLRIKKRRIMPDGSDDASKRISIVTGIHGDELEGQYVCFELARRIEENKKCLKGIVDIYPAMNPLGIDSITRGIPAFDLDMNRIFPGNSEGNMTELLAANILKDVAGSDVVLDIHASNIYLTEIPQIRINRLHKEELIPLAEHCNVDFVWVHEASTVLESTFAYSLIGMRITKEYGDQLVDGIFSLMHSLGMWIGKTKTPRKSIVSENVEDVCFLNAAAGGLFIPDVKHWEKLKRGDRIGRIIDPLSGQVLQNVESPVDGILFTIREYPIVDEGSLIGRLLKKEVMAV